MVCRFTLKLSHIAPLNMAGFVVIWSDSSKETLQVLKNTKSLYVPLLAGITGLYTIYNFSFWIDRSTASVS